MAFVIHPLTQQNGEPKYTANDFRLTVSNFLTAATGEAFGAVQGVRGDSFDAHASMSGSTITVHPHSGIIAPWAGVGAYAYAITSDITVPRPTTGDYYIVLVVEDPSQSHGSEPQGRVDLIPTSTPRESIDGLVIAQTNGTSINDIATRLRNSTVIETVSKAELDLIKPTARTKGFVRFGDGMGEYEFNGSDWEPVNQVISTSLTWGYGSSFTLVKYGRVVTCSGQSVLTGDMGKATNAVWSSVIPVGYRPAKGGAIFARAINNQYFTFSIGSDGEMRLSTTDGMVKDYLFNYVGTWITA